MLHLFKLAAYALFGYALYEFFRGLTSERQMTPQFRRHPLAQGIRDFIRHEIDERHRMPRAEGQRVETHGSDGGSGSHVVGRGVVSR